MPKGVNIDGDLVTWGDRLFYPGNRVVKGATPPKLTGSALRQRANFIRNRIEAIVRRAPQVMVKVTGGGRSMRAITAHFRYISKNGRLDIEDDRGEIIKGARAVCDLAYDWRFSGSLIPEEADGSGRREAFNIMLSMPRGTDPQAVQLAAREFARCELAAHKYVMVLHDHQANPHVHLSVRAERRDGKRLSPKKGDLAHWREAFAASLQALGIDAEATRQGSRASLRRSEDLWRVKAREDSRLRADPDGNVARGRTSADPVFQVQAWRQISHALLQSSNDSDVQLAVQVQSFASSYAFRKLQGPEVAEVCDSAVDRNKSRV